ncbi:nitroreductase [Dyadobacter sp. BE34]|uniref:Nitroreductase n=1 Tax=Dyadobacter fermentans TaxID=94254 RepID=A0ABU1R9F0_9BACT|nr:MULTISPECIES: nitroreductase family protein [Dyadobacter]MDR6809230.1 nitroreductase [Dyadobacter fermentans]MDR7046973.1 nitroreductase [Dyadobacter sp. BE242]MDR7201287.1 nitroreductase [Dyadobacter sp. BE34]MDR7219247.1 nitroreductase [Dyadobacter sp. BE31]MDR7264543.1 nitroreductase [Dyadobacter sp. BE32]
MTSIKRYVPQSVKTAFRQTRSRVNLLKDFYADYKKFSKYSASISKKGKERLESYIIKEYHAIEKGLALRTPRPGFGVLRITFLLDALDVYQEKYGTDDSVKTTIASLHEYLSFNSQYSSPDFNILKERIQKKLNGFSGDYSNFGGTKTIRKDSLHLDFDFEKFVKSRYSVRDFTDEPVDTKTILDAIDTARFTPSACNRQAWRVTVIEARNKAAKLNMLEIQNGNAGFREHINALIVITGKISSFYDYERYQVYIDAGMFAMTLLLALHAKGLGTCCLNMSVTAQGADEFNRRMNLDGDSVPIMYIAVGNLKDEFKVAKSQRKDLSEIVTVI